MNLIKKNKTKTKTKTNKKTNLRCLLYIPKHFLQERKRKPYPGRPLRLTSTFVLYYVIAHCSLTQSWTHLCWPTFDVRLLGIVSDLFFVCNLDAYLSLILFCYLFCRYTTQVTRSRIVQVRQRFTTLCWSWKWFRCTRYRLVHGKLYANMCTGFESFI